MQACPKCSTRIANPNATQCPRCKFNLAAHAAMLADRASGGVRPEVPPGAVIPISPPAGQPTDPADLMAMWLEQMTGQLQMLVSLVDRIGAIFAKAVTLMPGYTSTAKPPAAPDLPPGGPIEIPLPDGP